MSSWPTKPLRDLCDATRKITYGIVQPGQATVAGVPILRVNNFCDGGLSLVAPLRVDPAVEAQYSRSRPRAGDVLVTLVGSVGQLALAPPEIEGWNLARAVGLLPFAFRPDAEWAYYALRSPEAQAYMHRHANTTVQTTVNLGDLAKLPIPYPSRAVRHQILAMLKPLDDKIDLNRRMNATLEAMAQAVFRDWFVDFGPVRRRMEGANDPVAILGGLIPDEAQAAEIAGVFPNRFGDDDLPEGWSIGPVGNLIEAVGGSTPSTGDPALWTPAIYRWATPKDLSTLPDLALFETARRVSEAGLARISSGLLPAGTVLLSSRAPIGYLAIAQEPVAINQGFIALKPNAGFSSAHLYLWCKSNMDAILANANGSTFQEISKKNFRPIPMVVPPTELRQAFDAIAEPLLARIAANASENRTLAETRDYLLPRLMSGQVRVRDAEALLPAEAA